MSTHPGGGYPCPLRGHNAGFRPQEVISVTCARRTPFAPATLIQPQTGRARSSTTSENGGHRNTQEPCSRNGCPPPITVGKLESHRSIQAAEPDLDHVDPSSTGTRSSSAISRQLRSTCSRNAEKNHLRLDRNSTIAAVVGEHVRQDVVPRFHPRGATSEGSAAAPLGATRPRFLASRRSAHSSSTCPSGGRA